MLASWAGLPAAVKLGLVLLLSMVPMAGGAYLVYRDEPPPTTTPSVQAGESGLSFTISGTPQAQPAPGATVPVRLALTNPNAFPITVDHLTVQVTDIATRDDAGADCGHGNFVVHQFTGSYGFKVAATRTSNLGELGIRKAQWPQLTMINSALNQDACKNAVITLTVTGTVGKATA